MKTDFFTVQTEQKHKIKIKRSIFIAHLNYANNIAKAKNYIAKIGKEHKNANHNCWAYINGEKGNIFHSSDAGEPAGTAGKPILNALKKHNLTNIVAVVTRYFGGTKLGIRGLIEAYSQVTEEAIALASLRKIVKIETFKIETSYDLLDSLKYQIKSLDGKFSEFEYAETIKFTVIVEEPNIEKLHNYLREMENSGKIKLF